MSGVRRALVLGCGGTLGAAWTVAALTALEDALGWDARDAALIVGTSAGAEYGAMLAAGVPVSAMLAAQHGDRAAPAWLHAHVRDAPPAIPPLPRPRPTAPLLLARAARGRAPWTTALSGLLPEGAGDPGRIARLGHRLAGPDGWVPSDRLRVVAVDLAGGHRVAFGAPDAPRASLADALCATWAVPGCFAPVRIDGHRYVDGGVASPTSADLVLGAEVDEVVVLAPMASGAPVRATTPAAAVERVVRRSMSATLTREVAALEGAGLRVLRIDMDAADLRVAGSNFNHSGRRRRVLESALRTHRRRFAARPVLEESDAPVAAH